MLRLASAALAMNASRATSCSALPLEDAEAGDFSGGQCVAFSSTGPAKSSADMVEIDFDFDRFFTSTTRHRFNLHMHTDSTAAQESRSVGRLIYDFRLLRFAIEEARSFENDRQATIGDGFEDHKFDEIGGLEQLDFAACADHQVCLGHHDGLGAENTLFALIQNRYDVNSAPRQFRLSRAD